LIPILRCGGSSCFAYGGSNLIKRGGYDLQETNLSLSFWIVKPFVFEAVNFAFDCCCECARERFGALCVFSKSDARLRLFGTRLKGCSN
jgi:hypothetical protein